MCIRDRICNCHRCATGTFRAKCNSHNPVKVCHVPVHVAQTSASLILRLVTAIWEPSDDSPFSKICPIDFFPRVTSIKRITISSRWSSFLSIGSNNKFIHADISTSFRHFFSYRYSKVFLLLLIVNQVSFTTIYERLLVNVTSYIVSHLLKRKQLFNRKRTSNASTTLFLWSL